jgi:hypothetical protein
MPAQNPNRFTVTIAWLTFWLALVALGWFALDQRVKNKTEELHATDGTLQQIQRKHANLVLAHEQDLHRSARDAAERRRTEFEQALGGPLQAAFKDPGLSIRQALQRAALARAPTNADARVDVDRFTEFTVTFASPQNLATNEMTQIARELLPLAKPYLYALQFSVQGTIVAELDRADVDFIDDWSRASADRVAMLLAREVPTSSAQDVSAIERFKQERGLSKTLSQSPELASKMESAHVKFNQALDKSFQDLSAALSLSQKAISFTEISKPAEIDAHQRDLTTATARANSAKQFWTNPTNQWSQILASEGISGDAYTEVLNSLPLIFRNDPKLSAKVFEALDAKLESSRYFLKVAAEKFGVWQYDIQKGQFGFTDEEYAKRFRRAQDQLIQDSQTLESALRAWNEFLTR